MGQLYLKGKQTICAIIFLYYYLDLRSSRKIPKSMPVSKPKSPPKRGSKGKKVPPKRGSSKPVAQKSKKKQPSAPPVRTPTLWQTLSIDRKLDVVGVGLALIGLLTLLSLISAERSAPTAWLIRFLAGIFGWGAYFLPAGLIAIGVWLVLRNSKASRPFR
jgi:hypothetical protein